MCVMKEYVQEKKLVAPSLVIDKAKGIFFLLLLFMLVLRGLFSRSMLY